MKTKLIMTILTSTALLSGCGKQSTETTNSNTKTGKPSAPQAASSTTSAADLKWVADVSSKTIPKQLASGKINGADFKVEKATIQNGILEIRQGKEFFPDHALMIFLFTKKNEKLDGKTFIVNSKSMSNPHIHMKFKEEGKNIPGTKIFMNKYSMKLKFGKAKGKKIPAQIYICLPDEKKSVVAGTFDVEMK